MSTAINRLQLLHIHLIGGIAAVILAIALFFGLIRPKQDKIQQLNASIAASQGAGGTDEQVQQKKHELDKTKKDAVATEAKWQVNSQRYMPNINLNGPDILAVYEDRMTRIPTEWGSWVTRWYDAQRDKGIARLPGVEFPIPAYSTDPNAVSNIKYLTFPADKPWHVDVEAKTFDAAMSHLRRFNGMTKHGMPVVNNVALSGQSPNLTMSYDLALYVIPSTTPPAADPMLGGAAGGGSTPGGMGSMAGYGGMMGGSMGPMGGSMGSGMMRPGMGGGAAAAPTSKGNSGASGSKVD